MDKFSINYNLLDQKIKSFSYDQVKDKLIKIAFDVVKFNDESDIDGLWKLEKRPDGEVIVALYESEIQKSASLKSNWQVFANEDKTSLSFFYKNEPITKWSADVIKMANVDFDSLLQTLPKRLAENTSLRKSLLKEAGNTEFLMKKFPELYEDK